ncbi:MAG TPA: hypothetical protein VFS43_30320 [Polyangiaceae bacterium]|nr:hypothetical protein [Polyangiaceae bacterium]
MTGAAKSVGGDLRGQGLHFASQAARGLRPKAMARAGLSGPPGADITMLEDVAAAVRARELAERRRTFTALAHQWQAACGHLSSTTKRANHKAFRAIVAMGRPAIPLLLEQITRNPNDWDLALAEITGENPVPIEDAGRVDKIVAAWLAWGARHGYRR